MYSVLFLLKNVTDESMRHKVNIIKNIMLVRLAYKSEAHPISPQD